MFLSQFIDDALTREEWNGYPHNGGKHSLRLYTTPDNIKAFLELVKETYPNHPGTEPFCKYGEDQFERALNGLSQRKYPE